MFFNARPGRITRAAMTVLTVLALMPAAAAAQEAPRAPTLEILAAEYDHETAEVRLSLRADGSREHDLGALTALIDAVPHPISSPQVAGEAEAPAVLLAIDVSGSMAGAPIASASAAGMALVEKLGAGDTVGLLTFSDTPVVRSVPTQDASLVRSQLSALAAEGDTALHDAILAGLDVLGQSASGRRALVLLSDGEESGVSAASEQEVLAAVDASDVQVHTFALGAGADSAFLAELAERSGGSSWQLADATALAEVFAALGGRLGATTELRVQTAGLRVAPYLIEVRARIDGVATSANVTLDVPPASLLLGAPVAAAPGDPIEIAVSGVPADAVVRADIEGAAVPMNAAGTAVALDPWLLAPGDYIVSVRADRSDAVVASAVSAVRVPELAPRLRVTSPEEATAPIEATLRWQGPVAPALVALAGGREFARSIDGRLTVSPPPGVDAVEFQAVDEAGTTLATTSVPVAVAVEAASGFPWLMALPAVVLLGAAAWWLRRRRAPRDEQPVFRATRRPATLSASHRGVAPVDPPVTGRLVLTSGAGEVRIVPVGARPLTIGADGACDIPVTGPGVRLQHARLAMTSMRELQIHGLAGSAARPYEPGAVEQWLTLHPGDEIMIGPWSVRFDAHAAHEEAS